MTLGVLVSRRMKDCRLKFFIIKKCIKIKKAHPKRRSLLDTSINKEADTKSFYRIDQENNEEQNAIEAVAQAISSWVRSRQY